MIIKYDAFYFCTIYHALLLVLIQLKQYQNSFFQHICCEIYVKALDWIFSMPLKFELFL